LGAAKRKATEGKGTSGGARRRVPAPIFLVAEEAIEDTTNWTSGNTKKVTGFGA
jgi:hypothetical protein